MQKAGVGRVLYLPAIGCSLISMFVAFKWLVLFKFFSPIVAVVFVLDYIGAEYKQRLFESIFYSSVCSTDMMASCSAGNSERVRLELGIYDACVRSPEGADLLITAFIQALSSYRRFSVCAPFPSFLISDTRNKNFTFATEAVARFPPTKEVAWSEVFEPKDRESVVQSLRELSLEVLMVLNWILRFRYHLQLVEDPSAEFKSLLLSKSPWENAKDSILSPSFVVKIQESEEGKWGSTAFETIRSQHGSIMAFHGTTAENLHSILRCGLLNMSRTPMQRNGAMFGEGVYLSTDLSVAVTFSKVAESWERSCFGSKVSYVLLCEVAKGEGVECSTSPIAQTAGRGKPLMRTHGTYVVVQNSDLLRIRYVFIYSDSSRTRVESRQQRIEVKRPVNQVLRGKMSLFTVVIAGYLFGLIVLGYLKGAKSTRLSMLLKQLWWFIDLVKLWIDHCLESWTLPPKTLG